MYDSSPNPHVLAGGGIGGSVGYEKNKNDNFYGYLLSSSFSINLGVKGIIGGGIGGGDESFCINVGLGFELGLSVEQFQMIESISLTKKETSLAGAYSFWTVKGYTLKFDKDGSPFFEGTVYSEPIFGKQKNTNIKVRCFAVKQKNGIYLPSKIWLSYGYKNSIERKK